MKHVLVNTTAADNRAYFASGIFYPNHYSLHFSKLNSENIGKMKLIRILIIFIFFVFMLYEAIVYLLQDELREYYGSCSGKGRVLSKDEIVREASIVLLKNYPSNVIRTYAAPGVYRLSKPEFPIYYKNVDEFFYLNPGCCRFVWRRDVDEGAFGLFYRLTGISIGYVIFDYKTRFKNRNGDAYSLATHASFAVSSCGFPVENNTHILVK